MHAVLEDGHVPLRCEAELERLHGAERLQALLCPDVGVQIMRRGGQGLGSGTGREFRESRLYHSPCAACLSYVAWPSCVPQDKRLTPARPGQ